MIVDRDMQMRYMMVDLLKEMGYENVLTTASGTTAWTLLKQHGGDFIISGIQLKEISGLTLLKIVKADAEFATIPFLLLAEVITKGDVVDAGEAGVSEILCRPLTPERIKSKIEELLHPVLDPEVLEAEQQYQRGLEYMGQERWEEALLSFRRIMNIYKSPEIYYNMGYINTVLERYEQAIVFFRKATEIDQTFAKAYQKMAECYKALGDDKEADDSLNKAVEIYIEREKEGTSSEEILSEVLSVNPQTINIFNTMGIIYRRKAMYREAAKQYKRAIRVNPQDEHIYYNLGRCLMDAEEYSQALEVLERAIQIRPGFREAEELLQRVKKLVESSQEEPAPTEAS
jgi:tetratricopeptide (TPR) repeat protein